MIEGQTVKETPGDDQGDHLSRGALAFTRVCKKLDIKKYKPMRLQATIGV